MIGATDLLSVVRLAIPVVAGVCDGWGHLGATDRVDA